MQVYMYNSDDFDSLSAALREKRIIAAIAVFFQVGTFFPLSLFVFACVHSLKKRRKTSVSFSLSL